MSYNKSLLSQIVADLDKPTKPNVPRNQWQHPGEVTKVNSPNITMKGVSYPVLGVPDKGESQMMYPGQEYHFPEARNVTEYPRMQKGGQQDIEGSAWNELGKFLDIPQRQATKFFTGKEQYPSEALGIKNPLLASGVDFILDPMNIPFGAFGVVGHSLAKPAIKEAAYIGRNVKNIRGLKREISSVMKDLKNPESIQKMKDLGVNPDQFFKKDFKITSRPIGSHYQSGTNHGLNIDFDEINDFRKNGYDLPFKTVLEHELAHRMQSLQNANPFQNVNNLTFDEFKDYVNFRPAKPLPIDTELGAIPRKAKSRKTQVGASVEQYFDTANREIPTTIERFPHLMEMKANMKAQGIIPNRNTPITKDHLQQFFKSQSGDRISTFVDQSNPETYNILPKFLNRIPAVAAPVLGTGALLMNDKKNKGGSTNSSNAWYQSGGELPNVTVKGGRQPIIVTDKKDPRLKAYNDSLRLYKMSKDTFNPKHYEDKNRGASWYNFKGRGDQTFKFEKAHNIDWNYEYYRSNKFPGRIQPISVKDWGEGMMAPVYKKPTQPIEYKEAPERIPLRQDPLSLNVIQPGYPVDIDLPELQQIQQNTITRGKPLFPGGPQTDYYTPIDRMGNVVDGPYQTKKKKGGSTFSGNAYRKFAGGGNSFFPTFNPDEYTLERLQQDNPDPTFAKPKATKLQQFNNGLYAAQDAMINAYTDPFSLESMTGFANNVVDGVNNRMQYDELKGKQRQQYSTDGMFQPTAPGNMSRGQYDMYGRMAPNAQAGTNSFAGMNQKYSFDDGGMMGSLSYIPEEIHSTMESTFQANPMSFDALQMEPQPQPVSSSKDKVSFRDKIIAKESSGNYKALPWKDGKLASSAVGAYQFLWDKHGSWISQLTGVHSKQEFMNNHEAQDKAFDYWDKNTLTPTAKEIYEMIGGTVPIEEIKMAVHFSGPTGAKRYYSRGIKTRDAFGTTTDLYAKREMGGEMMLSQREIDHILAMGGEVEYV